MAIDQFGNQWTLKFKAGDIWASGTDDDGKPCMRRVFDRELVIDWSKPNAVRRLTLTDEPMEIDLTAADGQGAVT
ncbi:hypothetical protein IVB34_47795 [Bradyrhizobium sp. 2]|uniref:hypothetical protein n=1 Tax=unclassified Bradyrhizobium TaxID=2631580 RepID=UPI001FF7D580|nr:MULTISPECIES: hypothetical protein [unclassified Bradyrhizobium]MCK1465727.1 hypothetical protein [Bradyrhizobium sp. 2]MCK1465735.1 hypothetical protein [Bradyrhizobium sp. 2]MCK1465793.1 hypothetical protein [Bradyrhizobium sp. 2]MCK1520241.1 hypothetical protein [Bradyrhizobium sp. 17]